MQIAPEIYDQVMKGLPEIEQHMSRRLEAEKGAWFEVAKQAEGFDPDVGIVHLPRSIDELFAPPAPVAQPGGAG
jgi:hypothetical protein